MGFVARELLTRDPIVQLRALNNRNFGIGTVITGLLGILLYGVGTFLPLFLQTVLGYSAMDSGLAVSPRGLGSVVSMLMVGFLINRIDSRILLALGFGGFGLTSLALSRINLGISMNAVVWPNIINGFSGGFIFVPLTTLVMGRLRKEEMGNAAGIYNLVRNVGGSIGIAALTTAIVRGMQKHQAYLGAHLTASSPVPMAMIHGLTAKFAMGGADAVTAHREALGAVYNSLQQQSAVLAYADNFRLMGYLSIACIPLALMLARPRAAARSSAEAVGE